ncbi:MAG: IS21 family transposase [Candidatus Omnitrophica bacterium]|nr:IS21 family transposase [Candidatus Omnitrophota bacterium]
MRKTREILRLGLECGLGFREIARSCNISHPTAKKYLEIAQRIGLSWQHAKDMNEQELYSLLKQNQIQSIKRIKQVMPDWPHLHEEIKKKSVTLWLLWQEYKEANPGGYQYSQFREYYRRYKNRLNLSLRQTHKAGEKMFVDYAGQTMPIYERQTGQVKQAQIFVGVLGASNYTYAQADWDQSLSAWINAHVNAYEYFNGVPAATICDNLKSGVSLACRYEPDINPTYADMAVHYGTVVFPTRVRKPKDKSKVEAAVLLVERWILACLRNRKFFSLQELNQAIKELLIKLNQRPFKKLAGNRESVFKNIDQPALKLLPAQRYEFAQWKKARVNIDYHIELNGHYYSVPYSLAHEEVELRYNAQIVEIFYRGKRIAGHKCDNQKGRHTTIKEHMPKSHQEYLEWTPSRIIEMAGKIGKSASTLVERIMGSRQYPELGYRSCLGIMRLSKTYSKERLEASCKRALSFGAYSYKSVRSILEKNLDSHTAREVINQPIIKHENIRGSIYFNQNKEMISC